MPGHSGLRCAEIDVSGTGVRLFGSRGATLVISRLATLYPNCGKRTMLVEVRMSLLRLVSLLILVGNCATFCSFAQTSQSQPPRKAQPPSTQGPSEQRTPAMPKSLPPAATPKAAHSKPLRIIVVPRKKPADRQLPDGPLDPAIHLLKEAHR